MNLKDRLIASISLPDFIYKIAIKSLLKKRLAFEKKRYRYFTLNDYAAQLKTYDIAVMADAARKTYHHGWSWDARSFFRNRRPSRQEENIEALEIAARSSLASFALLPPATLTHTALPTCSKNFTSDLGYSIAASAIMKHTYVLSTGP